MEKKKKHKVTIKCRKPEETHVQQHFKNDCDMQTILRKIQMGDLALLDASKGRFMDLFDAPEDLSEAYRRVAQIDELFGSLPSKLRERFSHDPAEFAEWLDTHHAEADITHLISSVEREIVQKTSTEFIPADKVDESRNADHEIK